MAGCKELHALDDFLDKALSLDVGDSAEFTLPIGSAERIEVRYQRPVSIYNYNSGYCYHREVLWSPMKVRRYAIKQMGLMPRRYWGWDWQGWRTRRVATWWAREWGIRGP